MLLNLYLEFFIIALAVWTWQAPPEANVEVYVPSSIAMFAVFMLTFWIRSGLLLIAAGPLCFLLYYVVVRDTRLLIAGWAYLLWLLSALR